MRAEAAGRVRAIEVFGGYLDIDMLSAHNRRLIEEFAKTIGVRITKVDKLDQKSARKFGAQLIEFLEPTAPAATTPANWFRLRPDLSKEVRDVLSEVKRSLANTKPQKGFEIQIKLVEGLKIVAFGSKIRCI